MSRAVCMSWSAKDLEEAKAISKTLVTDRKVACVTINPGVLSLFIWEDVLTESQEVKVILKTTEEHIQSIQEYILSKCSYDVPEILCFFIDEGSSSYLSWLKESVKK